MNIKLNKKTILSILVILWIGFSVIYIGLDIWNDFKIQEISRAFESGRETGRVETINHIIQQTADQRCVPIRLFSEDREVNLIDIACLEEEM